ncbi:iron-sulfur cluster biosynthesis family protein [Salimicrobium halophilum]|uniref:Uncharacterized protein YqkB n=1 Tax=Salimicrobium halophilum TaxID=86666 RepID=A0A1G8PXD6_9BACI|nr:iron-sulfur cluster biosynthesis family protein [Salimicrobium halophilum]SDI96906.1 Uncharacterized protein YqkB [Salimicrobium halophilum]
MRMEFTDEAKEKLQQLMKDSDASMLRLVYDTDDCGCGVNGIPLIRLETERQISDEDVESDVMPVVVNKEQSLFFEDSMKVEVYKGAFRFKGAGGILNPMISPRQVCERGERL